MVSIQLPSLEGCPWGSVLRAGPRQDRSLRNALRGKVLLFVAPASIIHGRPSAGPQPPCLSHWMAHDGTSGLHGAQVLCPFRPSPPWLLFQGMFSWLPSWLSLVLRLLFLFCLAYETSFFILSQQAAPTAGLFQSQSIEEGAQIMVSFSSL